MTLRFENNSIVVEFTEQITISETWEMGYYKFKFVQLSTNDEFRINPGDYVKVIDGMLSDPLRLPMVGPFEKSSTIINDDIVKAGRSAILMIVSHKDAINLIYSPQDVKVSGPFSDMIVWNRVDSLPWGNKFQGVDFFNLRGWDIRNSEHKHVAYLQAWLAGSGVNCGNHNHSEMGDNTFREIHFCLSNGSGYGGMVWKRDGEELTLPLLSGEEHGPFWEWSEDLTKVVYPVHRWQAGESATRAYDFWFAVELPPPKAA